MFETDQKLIGEFARESADNMARVITFVFLTVQQPLNSVEDQMKSVDQYDISSPFLWGWKTDAYAYLQENKQSIYDNAMAIHDRYPNPDICANELLKFFAALPGLGLAKGGFAIQLCFGLSGCIDSHNLKRFGIPVSRFKAARYKGAKTQKTKNRIIEEYHAACKRAGGTAALWDGWCAYVAEHSQAAYTTAQDVSRMHCDAIFNFEGV